ncbi:hypothetical protein C1N61_28695 (plasmid) [Priestia aryabhattai]
MNQYIMISSPKELPKGCFGSNTTSKGQFTELDFTHLYFEHSHKNKTKKEFSFSKCLTNEFEAIAYANKIPLKGKETRNEDEKKCVEILFNYLKEAVSKLSKSQQIEMFTCGDGEEDKCSSNPPITIKLGEINDPYKLLLDNLEIIKIQP